MQSTRSLDRKTYTHKEVKEWEAELVAIPIRVEESKFEIIKHQTAIGTVEQKDSLAQQLHSVNEEIKPFDAKINAIEAQLEFINLKKIIDKTRGEIVDHEAKLQILRDKHALRKSYPKYYLLFSLRLKHS